MAAPPLPEGATDLGEGGAGEDLLFAKQVELHPALRRPGRQALGERGLAETGPTPVIMMKRTLGAVAITALLAAALGFDRQDARLRGHDPRSVRAEFSKHTLDVRLGDFVRLTR